jgi:glycosyltransferase involved in cell wall biosynthesis
VRDSLWAWHDPVLSPDMTEPVIWPTVSVVVPTVNRPQMLERAVRSIVAQDYPGRIDCLIVFDGTQPRGPRLELPENRTVRTLVNTRSTGLPGNRNTGYLAAEGVYIAACDDDDEWHPAKISAQVRRLGERPDAVLCATSIAIVRAARPDRRFVRRAPAGDVTLDDLLRRRIVEVCPSSSLFRRSLIDSGLLVDERIPGGYAEDYEWLLRVVRVGPIVSVPDPLTIIHWHDDSHFVGNWATKERALTYLLSVVPDFVDHPAGLARIEGQLALACAGVGDRRRAAQLAVTSLRRSRRIRQSYAALLVAAGLVDADRVARIARRVGLGT